MTDRPCDTEEPSPTVRHLHCDLRQRIDRFKADRVCTENVIELEVMRRRRDLAAAVGKNWSPHDTKEGA